MSTSKAQFLSLLKVMKDPMAGQRSSSAQAKCWTLLYPLLYNSALADRMIAVPAGYCTDFASVPRWPLAFMLTGDTVHAAAVVHDWIIDSRCLDRTTADRIFLEAMKVEGAPEWRRQIMFAAVHGYTLGLKIAEACRLRKVTTTKIGDMA